MYFKNPKSYIVPNSEEEGYSPILRNPNNKLSLDADLYPDLRTVYDVFFKSAFENPDGDYIGHRPYDPHTHTYGKYVFQTYKQVSERLTNFGAGLIHLRLSVSTSEEERNLVLARKWPVAIYATNRPEWNIADRSLATQSLYSVGLYDSLGEFAMEYILNHSESSVIVCSLDKIVKVLENINKLPKLKLVISMDPLSESAQNQTLVVPPHFNTKSKTILKHWAKSLGVNLFDMQYVESLGKSNPIAHHRPKPTDIYTLLYTSGTTGNPKAAVSLHSQYTAAAVGTMINRPSEQKVVLISYLPLPHAYGRTMENYVTVLQGTIGYFSGDITRIVEDCQNLNPTYFPGVPRLLSRFYDVLSSRTISAGGIFGKLSQIALKDKVDNLHKNNIYKHALWDRVVFHKTNTLLGNRLERMGTGTAPLSPNVMDFLRVALSVTITEGYAMTETSSLGAGQTAEDISNGNVGAPHYGVEFRLRSVPEMNYLVTDMPNARGEICMRGNTVFWGYLKNEQVTSETLIGGGWIASGDIGQINTDGSISIIDRKKSLFKTSQGVYISPDKVESYLIRHKLVLQAFVHGFSSQNYCVSVIVPEPIHFVPWAANLLNSPENPDYKNPENTNPTFKSLTKNKFIVKKFLEEMIKLSKEAGLSGIETIRGLYLEHVPFDIETNKLLTPTLKIKRFDVIKYYTGIITQVYESNMNEPA